MPVAVITPAKTDVELNQNTGATVSVAAEGCTVTAESSDAAVAEATLSGSTLTIRAKAPGEATITLSGTPVSGYAAPESKTIRVTVYKIFADGKYINSGIEITESHEEFYQQTSTTYHASVIITVADGKIADVKAASDDVNWVDSQWFNDYAVERLKELVGKSASALDVQQLDAVSGATFSTTALRSGTIDALNADKVVTWKNADGEALDRAFHVTGILPIYDGEMPTLENHQFTGWTPELAAVTEDVTYTAVFDQDPKYSVTYDLNGGVGNITDSNTYFAGETVTVASEQPTKEGCNFLGWTITGGTFANDHKTFVIGKGDATLKAVWEEIQSVGQYVSNETTDKLVAVYTEEFGPGSENEFDITFDYLLAGSDTPLFVTFDVTEGNQIDLDSIRVDIESDAYTASDFDAAVTAIRDMLELYGPDATVSNLQFVWTMLWIDESDGAEMPGYADIMLGMINALMQGVQEPQQEFAITTQPVDYYGELNSKATFLVEATGEDLSYQWQVSTNGGKTWSKSSVTQAKYEAKLTAAKDNRMVRCVVTNQKGESLISEAAAMHVTTLSIVKQPVDYVGAENSTARFTVIATGEGVTYQWQVSTNGGRTWSKSSVTSAVYAAKLTAEKNNRMVRCVVTDQNQQSITSDAAKMIIAN